MISAETYLDHVRRDGERIAEVAAGHLDDPVPSCPGNTVGSLLLHTAGVCMFWTDALRQNRPPESDWSSFPADPLEAHTRMHERFVKEISGREPDTLTWTWAGTQPIRFWYRRAAQELAVHRWDFENAVGDPSPIDATLAADGIDEIFFVFGPATGSPDFPGASERFDVSAKTIRFESTDLPWSLNLTAHSDRFESSDTSEADATLRGTASDLLLFLWGRVGRAGLEAGGDVSLLDRWQERVKI